MNDIALRTAVLKDAEFVVYVIDTTMRPHVVATWGQWDEANVRTEVQRMCSDGSAQIIEAAGVPIGVLVVERHATHIQLEQLFILPAQQCRGVGSLLVNDLMREAHQCSVPVRLRVLKPNSAKGFYEQLGFVVTDTTSEYFLMEYRP